MNNQQAINLLKGLEQSLDDYCELNDEGETAFGMAITALELFGNSEQFPSVQPEIEERNGKSAQNVPKDDLISRKAAIDAVNGVIADYIPTLYGRYEALPLEMAMALKRLPSAQPTLYGYNIKHLAFVATVMEKEGVTAEYAARTFDDISRILKMVIDEAREKILAEVVKKAD